MSNVFKISLVSVLTLGLFSTPTFAQDSDEDADVEEVIVTGSRIGRSEYSGINPVTLITSEDIEASGQLNISEVLNDLACVEPIYKEFKGWNCSVNWFFLHLEQQTDSIYHHQTCQARFDKTRGPIGKLSEGKKLIAELKSNLKNNTMPTVVCPKHTCGCGLCAPKSKYKENYMEVMKNHIDTSVLGTISG